MKAVLLRFLTSLLLTAALSASAAWAELRVVSSIKPLQLISAAIVLDPATTASVIPAGASPHTYQFKPSDLVQLEKADLILWLGPELEHSLDKALTAVGNHNALPLWPTLVEQATTNDHHGHDHDDDHHDQDPHIWLSLDWAQRIGDALATRLAETDPTNGPRYIANANAFALRLERLQQELAIAFAEQPPLPYVVYHNAYHFFEAPFGLKPFAVVQQNPHKAAGTRHVVALRQQLQTLDAFCLILEPTSTPALARRLSEGLAPIQLHIDPLGQHTPVSAEGYEQFIREVAAGFLKCRIGAEQP